MNAPTRVIAPVASMRVDTLKPASPSLIAAPLLLVGAETAPEVLADPDALPFPPEVADGEDPDPEGAPVCAGGVPGALTSNGWEEAYTCVRLDPLTKLTT